MTAIATPAPSAQSTSHSACSTPSTVPVREPPSDTEVLVNTALLARIEVLEAENSHLKKKMDGMEQRQQHFRLEQVKHDDKLICFYTGFVSYGVFLLCRAQSHTMVCSQLPSGPALVDSMGEFFFSTIW